MAKGRQDKLAEQKSTMRSALSTVRATVLEGSFGNEKNQKKYRLPMTVTATERNYFFFALKNSPLYILINNKS